MAVVGSIEIDTIINTKGAKNSLKELQKDIKFLDDLFEETDKKELYIGQAADLNKILEKRKEIQSQINDLMKNENKNGIAKDTAKMLGLAAGITAVMGVISLGFASVNRYLENHVETSNKLKSAGQAIKNFADGVLNVLGEMLGPYIEKFVNWLLKMLGYLNIFVKTISGGKIDMTKKMEKNEKATKKTGKAVKELNNQLAKFDEATKLNDKLDSGGGDIDENINFEMPTLDPAKVKAIEEFALKVKDVLSWIWKHLPEILAVIGSIKIAKWINGLFGLIGVAGTGVTGAGGAGLVGVATALLAVAAALSVLAAAKTWQEVINNWRALQDELAGRSKKGPQYEENMNEAWEISKDTKASVQQVTKAVAYNTKGITQNNNVIKNNVKTIKEYGLIMGGVDYILKGSNSLISVNTANIHEQNDEIQNSIEANRNLIKNKKLDETTTHDLIDSYIHEIYVLQNLQGDMKKGSLIYKDTGASIDMLKSDVKKYGDETQIAHLKTVLYGDEMENLAWDFKSTQGAVDGSIVSIMNYNNTDLKDKHSTVYIDANTVGADNTISAFAIRIAGKFQNAFNGINLNRLTNSFIDNLSKLFPSLKNTWSSFRSSLGLARGGIINLPGAGVPLGNSVVGGERGAEGVIPLTDSQQMEILGEAIGKYITINASITNTMNGRVISRELQKINGENDFANNR